MPFPPAAFSLVTESICSPVAAIDSFPSIRPAFPSFLGRLGTTRLPGNLASGTMLNTMASPSLTDRVTTRLLALCLCLHHFVCLSFHHCVFSLSFLSCRSLCVCPSWLFLVSISLVDLNGRPSSTLPSFRSPQHFMKPLQRFLKPQDMETIFVNIEVS